MLRIVQFVIPFAVAALVFRQVRKPSGWLGRRMVQAMSLSHAAMTDLTAGSLDLTAFDVNKGGLFRSFHENGSGKYRLHAHVTTGEIEVRGAQ